MKEKREQATCEYDANRRREASSLEKKTMKNPTFVASSQFLGHPSKTKVSSWCKVSTIKENKLTSTSCCTFLYQAPMKSTNAS
jgi:hypothetical protein